MPDDIAAPANTTTPLVSSVNDSLPSSEPTAYGELAQLVGTWNSPPTNPTGYNVMPVPAGNQQNQPNPDDNDWISKNFYYYEEMTFTAPGEAPNRGQLFQQGCYGLTYEQRVYFAEDPAAGLGNLTSMPSVPPSVANTLVHFENGLWLNLVYEAQPATAYGPEKLPAPTGQSQPAAYQISKQVSVPHGNSMLATGTVKTYSGPPKISTASPDAKPFNIAGDDIQNPALVLVAQLAALEAKGVTVTQTTEIYVDTKNPGGGTANLVFEKGSADVSGYSMYLFIEELTDNTTQLQYVQTISMEFDITTKPQDKAIQPVADGTPTTFLHIDANTLTKVT